MARHTLISAITAVTLGLVASLVLATPVTATDLAAATWPHQTPPTVATAAAVATARMATAARVTTTARVATRTAADRDGTVERPEYGSTALGSDGFTTATLARWRRRGSTVDRCARSGRRVPGNGPTGPRRVVSREQVTLGGCRYFLRHGTVHMDELALELAISRATLYRVVHSRDRLLADVLWRLAEHALLRARKERTRYGVEGVLEVGRRFSALVLDAKPLRTFLTTEPDVAARVLLTATGGVHHRAVQAQKEVFAEATPPGQVWLSGDLDSRAYLLVRIVESTLYADLLASRQPDRRLAEQAIRAVLAETLITT